MATQEKEKSAESLRQLEPLTEVVLGLSFVCPGFLPIDYGLFYEEIRDQFPNPSVQPAIATTNDAGQIMYVPSLPRMWFETEDRHGLVQLQENRLVFNWRKGEGNGVYPHFDEVFGTFLKVLSCFKALLDGQQRGPIFEQQYEFSYINNIKSDFKRRIDGPIFKWESRNWNESLMEPTYRVVQYIFNYEERAIKLRATTRPAVEVATQNEVTSFQIDVTSLRILDIKEWFPSAHELALTAFEDLLTPAAHKLWKQTT